MMTKPMVKESSAQKPLKFSTIVVLWVSGILYFSLILATLLFVRTYSKEKLSSVFETEVGNVAQSAYHLENLILTSADLESSQIRASQEIILSIKNVCAQAGELSISEAFAKAVTESKFQALALAESPEVREACSKQLQNQSQPLLFKSAKDFIVRYVLLLIPSKSVPGSSNLLMISMDGLGTSASGIQVITAPTGEVTWSSSNADDLSLFHVDPKLLQETTAKAASSDLPGLFQDGDVFASYAAISNRWVLFSYGFRSQVLQSVRAIEFEFFWLLLGSSFLVILFARRLVARLAEPLLELSSAAQKVSEGNFSTRILASGDREFRTVQNAFNHMAEELTRLIEVAKLSSKMESELELAKSVQQLLLPPEFLEVGTHQIRSTVRAATQCGGDWWGCIPTSEANGKFILMIGDVTGHGVPSALVTAATQGGKSVLAEWIGKEPLLLEDPRKLLELFNRAVYESSDGRLTMSFLLCVFNPEKNELLVSNAGHNWPYLIAVNPKGGHTLSAIGAASPVLGADRFQKFEHLETYPWPVGSKLVLYTDGLIDCYQGDKNLFDKRALLRVLRDVMGDTPKNILEKIFQIRESNTAGLPQEDDITLVICSRGPV